MKKKSDRQQTSDDWGDLVRNQKLKKFKVEADSEKLHTYRVVRTVEYSMLLDGTSEKDVSNNYRCDQLDAYWTRKEIKRTVTRLKGDALS
jgi:hypothetical protein